MWSFQTCLAYFSALFPFTGKLIVPIKWRLKPITSSFHYISGFVAPPAWFNWRMLAVIPRKQWVMNYYTQLLFIRCHTCVFICATRTVKMAPHIDERRQMTLWAVCLIKFNWNILSEQMLFTLFTQNANADGLSSVQSIKCDMRQATQSSHYWGGKQFSLLADSSSDISLTQSVPTVITFD